MIRLAVSRAEGVHVAVIEPGQERHASGFDDSRARADQRWHLIVGPDRLDPVAADGDGRAIWLPASSVIARAWRMTRSALLAGPPDPPGSWRSTVARITIRAANRGVQRKESANRSSMRPASLETGPSKLVDGLRIENDHGYSFSASRSA